jgi:hypothetical protein
MRFAAAIILLIFKTAFVFAQTTPTVPTRTPLPSAFENRIVNNDIMLIELEMAENGYTINKGADSKTRLLSIYEKVLFLRCLSGTFATLTRSAPATDQVCLDYSGRALKLDPGNPVGLCVRDGMDSGMCKAASEAQNLMPYDPQGEEKSEKASLDEVIALKREGTKTREQTATLYNKMKYLDRDGKGLQESLYMKKMYMEQILDLNCTRPKIVLADNGDETTASVATKANSMVAPDTDTDGGQKAVNTPDDFSKLLNEHFSTPVPLVTAPKSPRTYKITIQCQRYIDEALKIDPNMSRAICYKWGYYSWQCLNAKRREGIKNKPFQSDGFTRPSGNINSF